jgi:DNA modification methylase
VTGRFVTEKQNVHPTVKPVKLMKYLCRLITPKEGTVLDPFMGSGSTGIAAKDEGFDFIGIEKEKEYFEIAERRINTPYKDQINLFDNIDDEGV